MSSRMLGVENSPQPTGFEKLSLLFLYRNIALEKPGEFGGRGNSSILPLEWLSGKLKNLAALGLMPSSNTTSRFSDRVEKYVPYRPGYPLPVFDTPTPEYDV